jgi:hypothetical protein
MDHQKHDTHLQIKISESLDERIESEEGIP